MRKYEFESANKGTVTVEIDGRYTDGTVDLSVQYADGDKEFSEIDGGSTTDIIEWLLSEGVEFAGNRSMRFADNYIASVMIDGDADEQSLLDEAAGWTDEDCANWRKNTIGE